MYPHIVHMLAQSVHAVSKVKRKLHAAHVAFNLVKLRCGLCLLLGSAPDSVTLHETFNLF